ncbi:hypothetical protein [Brevibacillus parabrevis]|uniref:hypothetical protein n=1 Tax=Brevibacillus parabrevis TaxID=54914 RepID=UPI001F6251AA|nr:hypothetical protein [Brevibacillus parabrevis]
MNRYAYGHNNPLRFVDPSGHVAATGSGSFFSGSHDDLVLYWGEKAAAYADANHLLDAGDAVPIIVPEELRAEVSQIVRLYASRDAQRTAGDMPNLGLEVPIAVAGVVKNTTKNIVGNATESPALKGSPYHPSTVAERIKPKYQPNPAHDNYESAVRGDMKTWYGVGGEGKIYRYFDDNAGSVHFSGIVSKESIPNEVLKQLGIKYK